jgi:hypothetical protein
MPIGERLVLHNVIVVLFRDIPADRPTSDRDLLVLTVFISLLRPHDWVSFPSETKEISHSDISGA